MPLDAPAALDNDRASGEQERWLTGSNPTGPEQTGPEDEACGPECDRPPREAPGLDDLAEAWIALWQSELAGLAADPEVAAAWRQAFGLAATWHRSLGGLASHEAGRSGRDAPAAGPAPAPPAPGHGAGDPLGGADAVRVRARIDELERRLAALERGAAGSGADRRRPRRRRPSA